MYNYDPRRADNQGGNPPPQGQGRGLGGRFLIGILIALVALFLYWNQSEVNPVTGEKQHVSMTPNQEIKLGLDSAPQMAEEMGGELPSSDPRTQEVQKIGDVLVEHTEANDSPWKFEFHLLKDPETVNAFALPGGQIFITLGLYTKLQNEAQLAGVLGHEMGHVIERHTAQQMAKSQLGNMLVVAIATGASDQSNPGGTNSPMMIAAMVNKMIQLSYSRGDESQADSWGLKLMEEVGYDPRQMVEVMKILKAASGGGRSNVPSMFQTHPDPDLRIERINAYLKEHPPGPNVSNGKSLNRLGY
jgi:predicted Zn-dependent protease